ncbi:MAG TPA: ABC transporter substrate-binding protein [Gaiellaceae bacterium]|nr:ABC transporter substrate-binding protein [Gaiellaceae bacterium]
MKTPRFMAVVAGLAITIAAAASTATLASTRASKTHKKTYTFYLVAGIASDPFYLTMKKGAQAEAKKLGVKLVFTGSPKAFSPPTQIPYLNAAIARHPDAILIAPTDKTALIAPIRNAIKAGIPVETVDTFITAPIAFTNVSTDNPAGGRAAADALARAIGKKGTVAGISVTPGISTTDQRKEGFEQEIKKYPNIKYVGTQFDNDDETKAAQETAALLTRYPDLNGIFAMNVVSGDGVTAAVKNAGKSGKVKLVEFDAGPEQVAALRAGTVDALVAQYPYGIGQLGVQLAYKYVTGHRSGIKKHYGTGSAIVTRANVNSPAVKKYLYTP